MQVILTKDEYEDLVPSADLDQAERTIEWMRQRFVGNNCIHIPGGPTYCDFCPLSATGGKRDEPRPSYEMSKIACTKTRNYSK